MRELLEPYLTQGLTMLVQIAALAVFYGLYLARRKLTEYLDAHLDARQREVLHVIAREAYAFAETTYRELKGHEKLSHALDYLEQRRRQKASRLTRSRRKWRSSRRGLKWKVCRSALKEAVCEKSSGDSRCCLS